MDTGSYLFCIHCGAALPTQARFCPVCGQVVAASEPASGKHIVAELIQAPAPAVRSVVSTPLPAPPAAVPSAPAKHVLLKGRYRLLKQIGSGGYGDVHKAADTEFGGRFVAIKEMSQRGLSAEEIAEATEAFKHEAFLLAALTHPNLPSIYDYFMENGRWYLVMSFIEGETLEAYLARMSGGRLPVEKVLAIGTQLASVLSYLHTRKPPIIFRDLKPSNIMRTPDGQIYLIDFGIARHFKQGQTKDTVALGSPGYAAPEQYGRAQSTPQTDVYSLGATLHQMLSGLDPSLTPFHLPPLQLPGYPQLSLLIACMLDMDARRRPASMGNIKRELQRIANGRSHGFSGQHRHKRHSLPPAPLSVSGPQSVQPQAVSGRGIQTGSSQPAALRPPVPAISRRAALSGMGVIFLGSAAAYLFMETQQRVAPRPQVFAVANVTDAQATPAPMAPSGLTAISWSPRSKQIVYSNGTDTVHIVDATTQQPISSYSTDSHATIADVAWSPDGTRLACACTDGTILLWNPVTGADTTTSVQSTPSPLRVLAWSPNGIYLGLVDDTHQAQIYDTGSGSIMSTTPMIGDSIAIAWSPDSQRLACTSSAQAVQIWPIPFGQTPLLSYDQQTEVKAVAWSPDGAAIASAGEDGLVSVWDATSGKTLCTYHGHSGSISAVAWSPDGKRIASASMDQTVQVWSPIGQETAFIYREHNAPVLSLAWSPGGQQIASGDTMGTLRVWSPK